MLTNEVKFKAFAGVFRIADKLQPHGAGGGVQGGLQHLAARKHPQQTSLITAAIKDLRGQRGKHLNQRDRVARTQLPPILPPRPSSL